MFAKVMQKMQILMNKPVYLGLPILKLSKILMNDYDYVKPKNGENDNSVTWIQTLYTKKQIRYLMN